MKHLLSLLAVLAVLPIFTPSAHAIELRFKFDVLSSGAAIYACNAGLQHATNTTQYCYVPSTRAACKPGPCAQGGEPGRNCDQERPTDECVCTGGAGGDYLLDFMKADVYNTWDTLSSPQFFERKTVRAGQKDYAVLQHGLFEFERRIDNLTFDLGSEAYGAKYFVDICYRGSQIPYLANGVKVNLLANMQTTITELVPGVEELSYKKLALLGQGTEVKCVFQNGSVRTYGTPMAAAQDVANYSQWLVSNSANAVRFCRVRYLFNENIDTAIRLPIRKWQLHGAQVCTFTQIEQPLL